MKIIRLKAIAVKEFIQIIRDPRSLALAVSIPILLLLLFGYALTLDVDRISTVLLDFDRSPQSRELADRFFDSRYFELSAYASHYAQVQEKLDRGEVLMGLVIPAHFARDLEGNRETIIQILMDGTDANTATIALGYAEAIVAIYSQEQIRFKMNQLGRGKTSPPVQPRTRLWFNPDLESKNFIVPGLIAVILVILAAILTSGTVAREREIGTMEGIIVSPIRPVELILGKPVPFALIGYLDVLLVTGVGVFWFEVPVRGSLLLLFLATTLYLLSSLGIGLFISTISRTQQQALMTMFFFFVPAILLSGFIFPIASMPEVVQYLTYADPLRYFLVIIRGIFFRGIGFDVLWPQMAALAVLGGIVFAFSALRFRKRLE